MCKDLHPYSIVENEVFYYLLKTLEARYVTPSRHVFTDAAVPKLYREVKLNVEESLRTAERVELPCDAWTSRPVDSSVTITAHYHTEHWQLLFHVLKTRAVHGSNTGANIADLPNAAWEWGIADKDLVVVTNNASNMAVAFS